MKQSINHKMMNDVAVKKLKLHYNTTNVWESASVFRHSFLRRIILGCNTAFIATGRCKICKKKKEFCSKISYAKIIEIWRFLAGKNLCQHVNISIYIVNVKGSHSNALMETGSYFCISVTLLQPIHRL